LFDKLSFVFDRQPGKRRLIAMLFDKVIDLL
jgi:hypothetical protein